MREEEEEGSSRDKLLGEKVTSQAKQRERTEDDEIKERGSVGVKNTDGKMDGNSGRKVIL